MAAVSLYLQTVGMGSQFHYSAMAAKRRQVKHIHFLTD
jgi:hypothetical protein